MDLSRLLKKQLFWSRLTGILLLLFCMVLIVGVVRILPAVQALRTALEQVGPAIEQASLAMEGAGQAIEKMETLVDDVSELSGVLQTGDLREIVDNLEIISGELSSVNWNELSSNINQTALNASAGMDAALEAVNKLDIDTLNDAILQLKTVIEPLAKLVNVFH